MTASSSLLPLSEQENLLKKLQIFKIQGRDRRGHPVLRIIGKLFPARIVGVEAVKKYLEEEIFPCFKGNPFTVVYVHTGVNRAENFPGISALKSFHDAIPVQVREKVAAFYFLHPGIQSRLFLATFGRLLFAGTGGLYWKIKYLNRLEFLWDVVRRSEVEMPEFVYDFDEEMEYRPTVDYGLESDHLRTSCIASSFDSTLSTYSMRGIA